MSSQKHLTRYERLGKGIKGTEIYSQGTNLLQIIKLSIHYQLLKKKEKPFKN